MVRGNLAAAFAIAWLAMSPGAAFGQEIDPDDIDTDPKWEAVPSPEELGDAYPNFASTINVAGWAQLTCRATLDHRLAQCRVDKAMPSAMGFEAAALSSSSRFRIAPSVRDGQPRKAWVRFKMRFALAEEEVPAPWTGPDPSPSRLMMARTLAERLSTVSPAAFYFGPIDVDPANSDVASQIIADVTAEIADDLMEAAVLSIARLMTEDTLERVLQGRPSLQDEPSEDDYLAASPELFTVQRKAEAMLRSRYCALYDCGMVENTLPS